MLKDSIVRKMRKDSQGQDWKWK